jgi:hypothetical protein
MHTSMRSLRLAVALGVAALAALAVPQMAFARSSYFTSRCASCHTNDTQTCNGCHHHQGGLSARCDQTSYTPGDPVTVTLSGGTQRGWIRALLYDQTNTQLDRKSGPTNMGDDGLGNPVTFPVVLKGTAPALPGDYTWAAAWFGNTGDGGSVHGEARASVVIHVVAPSTAVVPATWDRIKSLFR